jgi:hypothetical protein
VSQARQSRAQADRHQHGMSRGQARPSFVRHARARRLALASRAGTRASARGEGERRCSVSSFDCHRMRWTARDDSGCRESRNIHVRDVDAPRSSAASWCRSICDWGDKREPTGCAVSA